MYNELSFLFDDMIKTPKKDNKNTLRGEIADTTKMHTVYKDAKYFKQPNANMQNYIKEKIYDSESTNENPYLSLLKDKAFKSKSKKLRASDFTYLRDLGVYPINRLIILRRYPEGTAVHDDLDTIAAEPISTVIGWLREDAEIFNISFNEEWETSDKYLHEIINDILTNEFKVGDVGNIIPLPGFTQGLMFGFFSKLGLTDKDSQYDIPFGDPNLLREAATRDYQKQGLKSSMPITFDTVYEQKYVGDIDPASAMLDIIRNLGSMGTSDTRYLFKNNSKILRDILQATKGKGNDMDAWFRALQTIIKAFTDAVTSTVSGLVNKADLRGAETESEREARIEKEKADKEKAENGETERKQNEAEAADAAGNIFAESLSKMSEASGILKSILAATFAKHRWPIRASIAAMTGDPTAPWHITIGNPWSPTISAGNMVVEKITLTAKGEMGFNDMPVQLNANITLRFGRNLGKQEIEKIFNNGYRRVYRTTKPS